MRRRLVLLILATTVLVVIALVVPLALLVRQQAADRAQVAAESDAQQVAGVVGLALAVSDEPAAIANAVGTLPGGTIVVVGNGDTIGEPLDNQGSLAQQAISTGSTVAGSVTGGWEVAIPVLGATETVAVDSFVSDDGLTEGVLGAWALLGALGLMLISLAVWVADRMARGLVKPIEDLAHSARRLADGEIGTRVEPSEPDEIADMGDAFNYLATRLTDLLVEERESVADLSHRLRTPLTSLRLQAESLSDESEKREMLAQVDRLERSMDDVISQARAPSQDAGRPIVLDEVVARRIEFWRVLADEQGRELTVRLNAGASIVKATELEVDAVVDVLMDNIFSYTPSGSPIEVATGVMESVPWLEVADQGPGFAEENATRGVSGGGSTGLGLDIVRKTAGSVEVNDRPGGGAIVHVGFERSV